MILNSPYISGSLTVTGTTVLSGSVTLASGASIAGTSSLATTALTASSVSNLNQNVQVTGSLTVSSAITAQTLVVQTVTSSVVYSSGSNIFGNSLSNVQQMTGSLSVTGSIIIGVTGSDAQMEVAVPYEGITPTGKTALKVSTGNGINDIFRWYDGGTQLGVFKNNGNIGVGTSSPTAQTGYTTLAINNNTNGAIVDFMTNGTRTATISSDTEFNVATITAIPLKLLTGNTEKMRITPIGNVGINSTNPVSTNLTGSLTVIKYYQADGASVPSTTTQAYSGNQSSLYLFGRNSGVSIISANSEEGSIIFGNASTPRYATIATGTGTSSVGGDMYFKVGSDTERMRITSAGNIAIGANGTTNVGGFGSTVVTIQSPNSTYATLELGKATASFSSNLGVLSFFNGSNGDVCNIIGVSEGANNSGALRFLTTSGGTGGERMRVTSTGAVLINTSTADAQGLSFNPSGTGVTMYLTNPSVSAGTEYLILNNTTAGSHTTTNMQFRRVGTVKGSITNDNSTTSFNTTSDYRLKEDLKDFDALSIVNLLKVYDFKWKIEDKRMHGVIAHEIAEVLPYTTVGEKDEVNDKGEIRPQQVDYGKLTPVLLKAIQEQQTLIESLKARIETLESK